MFVMTIDQQGSRISADAVPGVLAALEPVAAVVGFARTIGDEVQGVLADPVAVAEAVRRVAVDSDWHIGIGIGEVERPLPETTVEARGEAFYAARQAVEAAKSAPAHLVVRTGTERSSAPEPASASASAATPAAHLDFAEAALRLLVSSLGELRVQSRGYIGFRLDDPEATQTEIAESFGVSQQAVSRVLAPGTAEIIAGAQGLAAHHLGLAEGARNVD
ncbi:hypothetical protein [Brevibacterium sp. SMBL_HHYL_HB1]|uniref:hypothetical protein n=1 Tax=Brevibacterium sp. SMBL_HHYL_HB1 TaxID=2777556 RepID=UPI001BA8AE9A|nr:hypothetical protein [Brevibacterium sp. SMBL_HHYL_HB1]QUL80066.1 hypothetical protein IG171_04365 [Brevibacterium sp. SMBL_HHYL_HB1]